MEVFFVDFEDVTRSRAAERKESKPMAIASHSILVLAFEIPFLKSSKVRMD